MATKFTTGGSVSTGVRSRAKSWRALVLALLSIVILVSVYPFVGRWVETRFAEASSNGEDFQPAVVVVNPTPTNTPEPTLVPTSTPTATAVPIVEPFVEGVAESIFRQLCEDIQAEYPQAGCPIVAQEEVPLDHRFVAFADDDGNPTGYGLDLDGAPAWCEEDACDMYLLFTSRDPKYGFPQRELVVGTYQLAFTDEETRRVVWELTEGTSCEGTEVEVTGLFERESRFVFPTSSTYLEIFTNLGLEFLRWSYSCKNHSGG